MQEFFHELPSVIILAVLVAIFLSLQKHNPTPRVRLWLLGWVLVFLRFFTGILQLQSELWIRIASIVRDSGLQLAGVVFLVSVSRVVDRPRERRALLWTGVATVFAYTVLLDITCYPGESAFCANFSPWPYVLCLTAIYGSAAAWIVRCYRHKPWAAALACLAAITYGSWMVVRAGAGQPEDYWFCFLGIMFASYGVAAILFWRTYRKLTPGVVTSTLGLVCWSLVWATGMFLPRVMAVVGPASELWNVPKFIVAFGMILCILEEESHSAQIARERERLLKVQLERFADVTSQLLSGVDARFFCKKIAQTITEATTFERAAIVLTEEKGSLILAGHSGTSEQVVEELKAAVANLTPEMLLDKWDIGRPIGKNAIIYNREVAKQVGTAGVSQKRFERNSYWNTGDELLVALRTSQGGVIGFISLDDPRDVNRVTSEEMMKIEMLGADLAVALENARLHRRLVTSEKLAGVGQLVAGVAHELNNPLTAVLGYAELLRDGKGDEESSRGLAVIQQEALRMKRIIGNLIRFAQQDQPQRDSVDLHLMLDEILKPCSYDAASHGVEICANLPPDLPSVNLDAAQLKQVLVNLLSNAMEAVDGSAEKRITIDAYAENGKVVMRFTDTGPGFSDLNRAFDPFFTTKPPGKGTGLGLSICYGVIKQHGGDIYARNLDPVGACVTLELPVADLSRIVPASSILRDSERVQG